MAIKLHKEHIRISEILCSRDCQTTVENDVIVPDIKPDVLKILQVSSDVVVNQKNVQADKVYVQGIIRLNILYVPDGDVIGNVKSIMSVQDFSHLIDVKGAKPGMNLCVEAECEPAEYTLINSRKLNIRSKIGIALKVSVPSEIDVATDIEGDEPVQIRGSHLKMCNSCSEAERDIIVREQLEVPVGKPAIGEILKFSAKPSSTELRIIDNKAIVKGEVKVCTLYGGEDEECSVQFMEHVIPFTEILEIEGLAEGMDGEIDYTVKDFYYEIRQDSDGDKRILGAEITLCALVRASETVELDAIGDAFGLKNEISLERKAYNIEQLIENTFAQTPCKERAAIPDYMPELSQVCDISAVPNIENISIENGSVTVTGFTVCGILYLTNSGEAPLAGFSHTVPFSHTFDIPGICKDAICDARSDIEHISYTMTGGREIELRIIVSIGIKAVSPGQTELIDSMDWDADAPVRKISSMIIYFVQDGDTLWDIAKRYKTTPDAIIANNGSEKELLKSGRQIYIFR